MNITVGIFCKRKGFSQDLAGIITSMGHQCTVVPTFGKLMEFMKKTRNLDLLLIDDQTFPVPLFNVQDHVRKHNRSFGVKFLSEIAGEPTPCHMISQVLRPFCIRDRDYYHIVSLTGPSFSAEEKELLHRYKLRPGHVILLKYFEKHLGRHVRLDRMERFLWPESENHTQTLYTYIHQLRRLLPELNPNMTIERISSNTYCYHDTAVSAYQEPDRFSY